jgi:hypothetical protein
MVSSVIGFVFAHRNAWAELLALKSPVKEAQKRLEAFSKKTVTLKFKPSYLNELFAPLKRFDKQLNDLVVAIASIGAHPDLYKEKREASYRTGA